MPYNIAFYTKHLLTAYTSTLQVTRTSNSIRLFENVEFKFERTKTSESIIFHLQPLNLYQSRKGMIHI